MGDPFRHLAAGVIAQAIKDVRKSDGHAGDAWRSLQAGGRCAHLAQQLGVENDLARLVATLPEPGHEQLALGI